MRYGVNINVRLPESMVHAIEAEARRQQRSRSNLVRKILRDWLTQVLPFVDTPAPYRMEEQP